MALAAPGRRMDKRIVCDPEFQRTTSATTTVPCSCPAVTPTATVHECIEDGCGVHTEWATITAGC